VSSHEVFLKTSDGRHSIKIDDDFCSSLGVPGDANLELISLFVSSWITLLSDSPLEPEKKPYQLYRRFLNRLRRDGLKATILAFSDLAHLLVSQHSNMGSAALIGDWIDDFRDTPVFYEYHHYYQSENPSILDFLYTFLNFGKKLEIVDESFNEVAFRDWKGVENRLADLKMSSLDTTSLRRILDYSLPTFRIEDFRPSFGPGSISERGVYGRLGKMKNFAYDGVVDRFIFHGHIGMYGCGDDHGLTPSQVIPNPEMWSPDRHVSTRISRLMFVPKNIKTARSICMEPGTLMYFQQGIMREMVRLIGDSQFDTFIRLRDQSYNRKLSLSGSIASDIDTLDLSSASDSLSYALIKAVFPRSWQIVMRATRSTSVELPDGSVFHPVKFAPMGSALCFPVQCITFTAIAVYAACLYVYEVENIDTEFLDWLTPATIGRVLSYFKRDPGYYSRYFQPLGVYGDDICIDGRLTKIIKPILARLGFVVNESKSFVGGQSFRESCGGYYLAGNDITPLYFRIKAVRRTLTPSHVVSHVHLINEARRKGYVNLYRYLRRLLMTWGCSRRLKNKASTYNSIPYVSDPSLFGIVVSHEPKNSHLMSRENTAYQREEFRVWTPTYDRVVHDGDLIPDVHRYEYMRWWVGRAYGDLQEVNSSFHEYDTRGPGMKWRWMPLH